MIKFKWVPVTVALLSIIVDPALASEHTFLRREVGSIDSDDSINTKSNKNINKGLQLIIEEIKSGRKPTFDKSNPCLAYTNK